MRLQVPQYVIRNGEQNLTYGLFKQTDIKSLFPEKQREQLVATDAMVFGIVNALLRTLGCSRLKIGAG